MRQPNRLSNILHRQFDARPCPRHRSCVEPWPLLDYNIQSAFQTDEETTTTVDEKGNAQMLQVFAQESYRFNDKLSGSAGLHATYFSINDCCQVLKKQATNETNKIETHHIKRSNTCCIIVSHKAPIFNSTEY